MLPGKKYKPEDILQILKNRIWLLLVPFAVISAATAVVAKLLPDTYRSSTTIMVVPQRVPEDFVKSTLTTRLEDRLATIHSQITSRTRLERLITEFNLYADERSSGMIMQDIVERMQRRDIQVNIGTKGDLFTVSFRGTEPRTVQRVTEKLASAFIEESTTDRKTQAENTNVFLDSQVEELKRRLEQADQALAEYRKANSTELPSQQDANVMAVRNASEGMRQVADQIDKDQIRRQLLESMLAAEQRAAEEATDPATLPAMGDPRNLPEITGSTARDLAAITAHMNVLKQRGLKAEHWEMRRAQQAYDGIKARADAEALSAPLSATPAPTPVQLARLKRIEQIQSELQLLALSMQSKLKDLKELRATADMYQARVDAAPARETEMQKLTRDYDTVSKLYTDMLLKKEASRISGNLESRNQGETFKPIDLANFPERPISPNRPMINLFGMFAGLAVGLALIALLEYRDASFKTDDEIVGLLTLPVLAVVPLMQSDADRRRGLRRRLIIGVGLGSTVVGCLALLAYTFIR
jgi:polysaccharide chain length determinant protein (PEP-CTERM system associated)